MKIIKYILIIITLFLYSINEIYSQYKYIIELDSMINLSEFKLNSGYIDFLRIDSNKNEQISFEYNKKTKFKKLMDDLKVLNVRKLI